MIESTAIPGLMTRLRYPHEAAKATAPATLSAVIGRETADIATILFQLPLRSTVRAMFEAEIHDAVAMIFEGDPALDPGECEQCCLVAWVAFDRRLSLHAVNQHRGGVA